MNRANAAAASKAAAIKAMARVEAAAGAAWNEDADDAVFGLAKKRRFFTSDDVWLSGLPKPREPRALGPVIARAIRDGIIENTQQYVNTTQVSRNHAPIRIWRSRIFAGGRNANS
jgi:hypothetical protein